MEAKKDEEEKQYLEFCENLKTVFKKNTEDMMMNHVALVTTSLTSYEKLKSFTCIKMNIIVFSLYLLQAFFPIIAHEHFYLVVFNLIKGTSVIIDNSPKPYDAKYQKEIDVLVSN